jgi:hypothetical protein
LLAKLDLYSIEDIYFIDSLELQLGSSGSLGLIISGFGIRFGIWFGTVGYSSKVLELNKFQKELLEIFEYYR